jgi:hypothetical protein
VRRYLEATLGVTVDILALASGNGAVGTSGCASEGQEIEGIINVGGRELLNNLDLVTKGLNLLGFLDGLFLLVLNNHEEVAREGRR